MVREKKKKGGHGFCRMRGVEPSVKARGSLLLQWTFGCDKGSCLCLIQLELDVKAHG